MRTASPHAREILAFTVSEPISVRIGSTAPAMTESPTARTPTGIVVVVGAAVVGGVIGAVGSAVVDTTAVVGAAVGATSMTSVGWSASPESASGRSGQAVITALVARAADAKPTNQRARSRSWGDDGRR